MKIKYLDGKRFYLGLMAGGKALITQQGYLNKINVFPVADADTGINLAMTMQAILEKSKIYLSLKDTLHSVADSALSGARGNSGIILAQYLHGLSKELSEKKALNAKHFAQAAQNAVKHLYDSLLNPVEGTMLTVIREWSDFLVEHSGKSTDFLHLLTDSLAKAKSSLAETPKKLKVLAEAGVVDAGASGFVFLLEGIVNFIHRGSLREAAILPPALEDIDSLDMHTQAPEKYRFCSEAILCDCIISIPELKSAIADLGDSLILAGDIQKLHIHLHTNEPERVFGILDRLGKVSGVKVDDMLRQYQISNQRKYPIGLITDSACDLPAEILDSYQIAMVPFGINFGNSFFLDKLTLTPDKFYQMLDSEKTHPVSSQPSPATVKSIMDFSAAHYDHVIAVHISDKLSGMMQSAKQHANQRGDQKLSIINTKHLSVSEGLVMLRIARAVEAGISYDEIMLQAQNWIANTRILTDVNTLRYMVRGGRVKPLTGFVAAVLNLKPIVSLDSEGKALAYGKSFSRSSNMSKIVAMIKEDLKHKKLWEYAIVHASAQDRAEQYAALLAQITGKKPAYIMPLSPVVGVHNGIGAVGIGVAYDA